MSRVTAGEISTDEQYAAQANRGRWLVLLAALLWSTGGLFGKAPVFHEWPVENRGILLAFWRALFAGALLLPLVRQPRWNPRLVPASVSLRWSTLPTWSSMSLSTAASAVGYTEYCYPFGRF